MQRYILSHTIIFCLLFSTACFTPDYKLEDTVIPPLDSQLMDSICDEILDISNYGTGSNLGGTYSIGDVITSEHLLEEFNYCYPSSFSGSSFRFDDHPNKVFMIEMSATW